MSSPTLRASPFPDPCHPRSIPHRTMPASRSSPCSPYSSASTGAGGNRSRPQAIEAAPITSLWSRTVLRWRRACAACGPSGLAAYSGQSRTSSPYSGRTPAYLHVVTSEALGSCGLVSRIASRRCYCGWPNRRSPARKRSLAVAGRGSRRLERTPRWLHRVWSRS